MSSKRLLVWVVLSAAAVGCWAQSPEVKQREHTAWSARDGSPPSIEAMRLAPDGSLLLRAAGGAYRFDGVRFARVGVSLDAQPATTVKEADGAEWRLLPGAGVERLLPGAAGAKPADQFRAADGLTSDDVRALLLDGEGDVWVATAAGLDRFSPPLLARYLDHPVDPRTGVLACSDGLVWMGGPAGLVGVHADGTSEVHQGPVETLLACDGKSGVWFRAHGLLRLGAGRVEPEPLHARMGAVTAMTGAGPGQMYAAVSGAGVWRQSEGGWRQVEAREVRALLTDSAGQVWMSLPDAVERVDPVSGTMQVYPMRPSGAVGQLDALVESNRGLMAAGEHGLAWLEGDHLRVAPLRYAESKQGIAGVAEATDDLWLNTARGIFRVPETELAANWETRTHTLGSQRIGPDSPAPTAGGPSVAWQAKTGKLWFASGAGVVSTGARDYDPPWPRVRPHLVSMEDNGRELPLTGGLVLGKGEHRLRFVWQAVSLSDPGGVQYGWQLVGRDAEPRFAGRQTELTVSGLRPGSYVLHVGAVHGRSGWTEMTPFQFTVEGPWWRRMWVWWALSGVGATAVLGTWRGLRRAK